ncbi:O-antigen ligase family protein [Leifsonia sp. YIM 134122]|uniref:O-antigen ligase family protein n=1 Tax=Leifsonia stereocauli TaxID=3134136 RepID=A0ABU9W9Z7_9MICO
MTTPVNRLAQAIAVVAIVLIGSRLVAGAGIAYGSIVALLLVPLWIPVLKQFTGARLLVLLGVVAAVAGLWLGEVASSDHVVDRTGGFASAVDLVGLVATVGVILWARGHLPVWAIGALYGLGMVIGSVAKQSYDLENPWKFGLGFPISIIILALVSRDGRRVLDAVALLALSVASILTDSRYRFATLMIAAFLVLWQMVPSSTRRARSALLTVVLFGGIAAVTYNLATTLIVDGYLGEQAQERSIAQIDQSGSLILGGRPELAASVALFQYRPTGYGTGVTPALADIIVAKSGMAAIGYQPNNGYVEGYLFGSGIELHSITGDVWSAFGIAGLVLVAAILVLILRGLGMSVASRTATGLTLVLSISTLWNLLFSPLGGSYDTLVLALGLALTPVVALPRTTAPEPSGRVRRAPIPT